MTKSKQQKAQRQKVQQKRQKHTVKKHINYEKHNKKRHRDNELNNITQSTKTSRSIMKISHLWQTHTSHSPISPHYSHSNALMNGHQQVTSFCHNVCVCVCHPLWKRITQPDGKLKGHKPNCDRRDSLSLSPDGPVTQRRGEEIGKSRKEGGEGPVY
jgi:hypothetical protein